MTLFSFVLEEKEECKDKNPEEMNRLRDQLVGTFKEQMDIRLIFKKNEQNKQNSQKRMESMQVYFCFSKQEKGNGVSVYA